MRVLIRQQPLYPCTQLYSEDSADVGAIGLALDALARWILCTGGPACDPKGSMAFLHGFSAEPVPVSAYVGSSKNLQDLKD